MMGQGGLLGDDRPEWPSGRGLAGVASKARSGRNGRILQSRGSPRRYRDGRGVRKLGTGIVWLRLRGVSDSGVVSVDRAVADVKGVDRSEVWGMS